MQDRITVQDVLAKSLDRSNETPWLYQVKTQPSPAEIARREREARKDEREANRLARELNKELALNHISNRLYEIIDAMIDAAVGGNITAADKLLDRLWGKAPQGVSLELGSNAERCIRVIYEDSRTLQISDASTTTEYNNNYTPSDDNVEMIDQMQEGEHI